MERTRTPSTAFVAFIAAVLLLFLLAQDAHGQTTSPVSSLIINQDGQVITSISSPSMGTQLWTGLDFRPASRVHATLELTPGAEERLLILTQLERPIFSLQSPDGRVTGQEMQQSYVVQGNGAAGNAVLSISGSLPVGQDDFSVVQMVSENGHGVLEAINIRGNFEAAGDGISLPTVIAVVEGALLAVIAVALAATLQSRRRSPVGRF